MLRHIERSRHVGVGHAAREGHLPPEARLGLLILQALAAHALEGHRRAELLVAGLVHLAHAAAAEEANDDVAPCEERPRGEEGRLRVSRGRPFAACGAVAGWGLVAGRIHRLGAESTRWAE